MFLLTGLANGRPNDPVPTQYSANRALIGLCIQTVQLQSTTLTLKLDTLKLKDAVEQCYGKHLYKFWIFMPFCLSYERV